MPVLWLVFQATAKSNLIPSIRIHPLFSRKKQQQNKETKPVCMCDLNQLLKNSATIFKCVSQIEYLNLLRLFDIRFELKDP